MKRIGRVLAALALALPFTFSVATLVTAGGCSGSSGTGEPAKVNGGIDKVAQAKMGDYIKNKPPLNGPIQKKK
jgi:hypothetical protein